MSARYEAAHLQIENLIRLGFRVNTYVRVAPVFQSEASVLNSCSLNSSRLATTVKMCALRKGSGSAPYGYTPENSTELASQQAVSKAILTFAPAKEGCVRGVHGSGFSRFTPRSV